MEVGARNSQSPQLSFVHSSADGQFLTATDFHRLTSVMSKRFQLIREELEDRRLPGVERVRSQLNVDRVQKFNEKYRTSLRTRRLTFKFMLPTYALEQMICMGVIPREDDDAVRIIRHGMCVQQECVDQLITDIKGKVISGKAPKDAIAIETAARQIGGRQKPWGAIFDALRKGRIEFWLVSETVSSRTVLVRPSGLACFHDVEFSATDYPRFPFSKTVNGTEIEEILNVGYKYLPKLIQKGLLSMSDEEGKAATLSDVVALARLMVSPAELGHAMKRHPRPAGRKVAALGVRRIGCGWSRQDLVAIGIIRGPRRQSRRQSVG